MKIFVPLVPVDELLWSPSDDNNENIDKYLKTIHGEYQYADDEISLQTLLNCQMNTDLALVKFRQLPVKTICKICTFMFFILLEIIL